MSQSYQFCYCETCRTNTVHCKPSDKAPVHFCMRHQGQVLKGYDSQADRMREAIMEARQSVTDFPSWQAIRNRN